ncbi:MAG: YbjN domain-containing protein [Chloroflexi bacterium]|nr:YbjN domain-containing protein [Chloroflexota bacterium]
MASRQPVMRIPAQERYYPELVRRCLELNAFLADLAFQCG